MGPRGEMGGPWWGGGWSQAMGGMGVPTVVVVLVALVVVLALIAFFRRPAGVLSAGLPNALPVDDHLGLAAEGAEEDALLVVPDISGYTRFVSLSRFAAGHAQRIISDLLGTLIEAGRPNLVAVKIEGDAVLFAGPARKGDAAPAVGRMLAAFYSRREALRRANLCPCDACERIASLDLKVVVHRGPVMRTRIGGSVELSGMALIVVHRLLKNTLEMVRYVLVTQAARCRPPLPRPPIEHVETYSDIGPVALKVYPFEPEDIVIDVETAVGTGDRARDLAAKLAANARTLGRSLGLDRAAPRA